MLPQQFHVVPVFNYAMVHGILHLQQSSPLRIELLTYYYIRLVRCRNDYFVFRATDTGLALVYIEENISGFYSPEKPALMNPLP
jgi:hypothetical protein